MKRLLVGVACFVLAVAPLRTASAHAFEEPAAAEPVDELAEAKALHLEAVAKYDTADYEGAIETWQKAYAALPSTAAANSNRASMQYNIAASFEKLYELRKDVTYLKQARTNLQRFAASIDETYAGAPELGEKERANVNAKLARLEEMIAAAEREPVPPPAEPRESPKTPAKPIDEPAQPRDPSRGYFAGGGVLLGVGLGGVVGMAVALVEGERANSLEGVDDDDLDERKERFDRGRAANAGAIAAGVLGGLCIAGGVALVVLGAKKRSSSRTAVAPMLGRGLAGIGVAGRF